jgi:hypothetical protein
MIGLRSCSSVERDGESWIASEELAQGIANAPPKANHFLSEGQVNSTGTKLCADADSRDGQLLTDSISAGTSRPTPELHLARAGRDDRVEHILFELTA